MENKDNPPAQLIIGDTSFTKLADGFIQVLTRNGCVELVPEEITALKQFASPALQSKEGWNKPVDGFVNVPDELDPIIRAVGMQMGFMLHSDKNLNQTICDIVYKCQQFFNAQDKKNGDSIASDIMMINRNVLRLANNISKPEPLNIVKSTEDDIDKRP